MSAAFDVDSGVTAVLPLSSVQADDPFARLFFDRTTTSGVRLLAMAEPVVRKPEGYLTATAAIAAFEEALVVAVASGAEAGLRRAFIAANEAVRSANRRTMASRRSFVGITAFVIQDRLATIGFIPPGQALLIQDGQLYGVPDLASWTTGFMPLADQEASDPLGFSGIVHPQIRKTEIGVDDQFVLGASAVGRVLASRDISSADTNSRGAVIDRLEEALADSGIDDAYAAWIRCDPAPTQAVSAERMAEIERTWRGEQRAVVPQSPGYQQVSNSHAPRAARLDSLHGKLIDTSERWFARREPECLPLESRRRQSSPPGAGSLERFVAPGIMHFTPELRSFLPRGFHLTKRVTIGLLLIACLVTALVIKRDVALGRDARQGNALATASSEIQHARQAESTEEAREHLDFALASLKQAEARGASEDEIAAYRNEAALVADQFDQVRRLNDMTRVGTLPASIGVDEPRLLLAGDRLFLITDSVFVVDPVNQSLMKVLSPGDVVSSTIVFPITASTVDSDALLVSDGRSLFRFEPNGVWSMTDLSTPLPEDDSLPVISAAFKGSYYLLDTESSQVKKFGAGNLDAKPSDWLSEEASASVDEPVDLAVDGNIYLLSADGSIQVFYKGELKSQHAVIDPDAKATVIGLYRGASGSHLYVVAVDSGKASLVRYNKSERTSAEYQPPTALHIEFDPAGGKAFAQATDFVVDERTGTLYFVTGNSIWQASLS